MGKDVDGEDVLVHSTGSSAMITHIRVPHDKEMTKSENGFSKDAINNKENLPTNSATTSTEDLADMPQDNIIYLNKYLDMIGSINPILLEKPSTYLS